MKSEDSSRGQDVSIRQFAAAVFHESLVTGVPNIVRSPSWKRRLLKIFILVLCLAGFLYQSSVFVTFVLSYPSVVDIHVHTPKQFLYPAFTMCNNNGIKRSKFCDTSPDKCETPENKTEFCNLFPYYCDQFMDWKDFKVPKSQFHEFENSVTLLDLKNMGHEKDTFILEERMLSMSGKWNDIAGPLIFFKNFKTAFACYTIHSRANSSLDPDVLTFFPLASFAILELTFDFERNETFLPGREPGGLLAIHSPFEMLNPYDFGVSIKPGNIYKIHLKMEEEELLPFPYQSSCVNYTRIWLDNGRKGPRSQEMCKQTCIGAIIWNSCNCSFKQLVLPYEEDMCFTDDYLCLPPLKHEELTHCVDDACPEDCQKYKFMYVIQERAIEEIDWLESSHREKQVAYVHVYASDPEVVVYKYRPHYQNIEVFSYIGGYIGAWLGISLMAVADFFECLLRIIAFALKQRKDVKRDPNATSAI